MKFQAFVLAAGLGTRLRPLTNDRPKALVEVGSYTLLEINLKNLIRQGATQIVVNVHHFPDKILNFIESKTWGVPIVVSDERDLLLDTGGGLKHAEPLFLPDLPIVVHNVDILSDIDFQKMLTYHTESKSIATLATSIRDTSRYLLIDDKGLLVGWENKKTGEYRWSDDSREEYKEHAFSGIAIVEPRLLELLPPDGEPYPIIPAYLDIAKHHTISTFQHESKNWIDVGKPETLEQARHKLATWKLF